MVMTAVTGRILACPTQTHTHLGRPSARMPFHLRLKALILILIALLVTSFNVGIYLEFASQVILN